MLSLITDVKNFVFGTVTESFSRAGRWGHWAFGYRGDAINRSQHADGHFSHFRLGGLIWPAIIVGALTMSPAVGLGVWLGGTAAAVGLGFVTGALSGGIQEVRDGWEIRAAKQALYQQDKINNQLENNAKIASRAALHATDATGITQSTSFVEQLQQERAQEQLQERTR